MIVLLRYPFFFRIFNALVMSLTLFLFENIVNREKSLVKNLIISLCFCLYPIWLFGEVGWAATSLTYLWTLFACLVAIRPFVMELYGENVQWWEYCIAIASLVFGAFQEQVCAILLILICASLIYRCCVQKRFPIAQITGVILIAVMLVYIFTCPGNANRTYLETLTWFPEFQDFSLFKKIEIGFSSTIRSLFLEPSVITPVFCLVLAIAVYISKKSIYKRIIASIPLAFSLIFGLLGWLLRDIDTPISYFYRSIEKDGTGFDILSPSTVVPDVIFVIILAVIIVSLRYAIDDTFTYWLSFIFLGVGAASRIAMGLSPTVWASGNRTCIFLFLATDVVLGFLLYSTFKKIRLLYKPQKNLK